MTTTSFATSRFVSCVTLVGVVAPLFFATSCSLQKSQDSTIQANPPSAASAAQGQCPAVPSGASAASAQFINELVSHFGKLQFQGKVRIDSQSPAVFGVAAYDFKATTPLVKAATLNLTEQAGGTPTGVVAGAPDLLVQFSLKKEDKQGALANGRIIFFQLQNKNGQIVQVPAPVKIDLMSQNSSKLSWTLNSIEFKGEKVNAPQSELKISGSCELLQETVRFSLERNGKIKAVTGNDKSKCLFVMKYDVKCNKFNYQFDYGSPAQLDSLYPSIR